MTDFLPAEFFDLATTEYAELFAADRPVWEALGAPAERFVSTRDRWDLCIEIPEGVHILEGPVAIAAGCIIEPGAVIRGPVVIGEGSQIRTGAYLRGPVIIGRGCVVGAHSELKRAILLDGANAPHQNYVGDSILGRGVNLGAGTILSNVRNIGHEVTFRYGERTVHTGLKKLGAILGDGCKTGCNTVLNPGVVMGPGCVTYPNVCLRSGHYPAGTLVKLRQQQQRVEIVTAVE